MLNRLLRTRPIFQDESLLGHLLRINELNGYYKITWIFDVAGIPSSNEKSDMNKLLFSDIELTGLSRITGIDIDIIKSKTHSSLGGDYCNFHGHALDWMWIHSLYPKVCPKCLVESSYCKIEWDCAFTTCCPQHKCLLINRCPACNRKISWLRSELSTCKCGFDFRETLINNVPDEETKIASYVSDCLLCRDIDYFESPNALMRLPLGEMASLIFAFGRDFEKGSSLKEYSFSKMVNFDIHWAHRQLNLVSNIFENWPVNFHSFLDNTKFMASAKCGEWGLRRRFGILYHLIREGSLSSFPLITEEFDRYIVEKFEEEPLHPNVKINRLSDNFIKKYMSGTEVAKYLKISEKHVDLLLSKGLISGAKKKLRTKSLIMIERDSVERYKVIVEQNENRFLTLKQVADLFSIGKDTALSLKKAGIISPEKSKEIFSKKNYCREKMEQLLLDIDAMISCSDLVCNGDELVTFNEAYYRLRIKKAELIAGIVKGEIIPLIKSTRSGFEAYSFSQKQIQEYKKSRLKGALGNRIPLKEYSRRINICIEELTFLARIGLLQCEKISRIGRAVSEEEIREFESKYVFCSKLAAAYKTYNRNLADFLKEKGVAPVSDWLIDGAPERVYRKESVEKVDFSGFTTWAKEKGRYLG